MINKTPVTSSYRPAVLALMAAFALSAAACGSGKHPATAGSSFVFGCRRVASRLIRYARAAAAGGCYCSLSRRSVRTISMIAATVSWRAQSRCSPTASETQLTGCAPACITRSRPARWASGEVPPIASTTG